MAMTASQRVSKQFKERKAAGWKKITVWVPTEEDREALRMYAQQLRDAHTLRQREAETLDVMKRNKLYFDIPKAESVAEELTNAELAEKAARADI